MAISEHNPSASELRMREHIDVYVQYAEKKFPGAMDRVIPWGAALETN